jgi:hypothetical protein
MVDEAYTDFNEAAAVKQEIAQIDNGLQSIVNKEDPDANANVLVLRAKFDKIKSKITENIDKVQNRGVAITHLGERAALLDEEAQTFEKVTSKIKKKKKKQLNRTRVIGMFVALLICIIILFLLVVVMAVVLVMIILQGQQQNSYSHH